MSGTSLTITEVLSLMAVAGAMACAAGRTREDCPYDPIYFPAPYNAWISGWDEAYATMKTEPVGA